MSSILKLATKHKLQQQTVQLAAIDGTGFESRHISRYFVRRRERCSQNAYQTTTYTRFPKVGIVVNTLNHLILSAIAGRGPGPDVVHFRKALAEANHQVAIRTLVADAGYDSEGSHVYARTTLGVHTIIPPLVGRKTSKLPTGKYRRSMAIRFNKKLYGQRW